MLKRILIVDSDEKNRGILREILSDTYEISEEQTARKATAFVEKEYKTLVAVLVSEKAAPNLTSHIRHSRETTNIPVIAIIKGGDDDCETKAFDIGANDFLTLPFNPITVKKRVENAISLFEASMRVESSKLDELTGLYTRQAFFDRAADLIALQKPGYYVMDSFDINNFKVINDQYGSKKGDEVLSQIGKVFKEGFREISGVCSRITADNFAILYPSRYIDSKKVESIKKAASALDGTIQPISFAIGRYVIDDLSVPIALIYDRAAIAGASIKQRADKECAVYDEAMREQIIREQEIVNDMKDALQNRNFVIQLQPQYNHSTGKIIGAEALVRWHHPEKGMIFPNDFIPVFEKNGFIYEMDKYVWEEACALLNKWAFEGQKLIPISVNISRYDLFRNDLMEVLVGLLNKYSLQPEYLHIEITESAFAESEEKVIQIVKELIDCGFTVQIDDFGSGYSSLNTLKDVPSNVIKLDMKFLDSIGKSKRGGNIVESVIRMAKWLGVTVIAEGVETVEQAEYLKTIGCNYVQGYLYAKPMPVEEYEKIVKETGAEKKKPALETVEQLDNNAFWDPESIDTLIFNSFVAGACIFEYDKGKIELLRATEKYIQIFDSDEVTVESALSMEWEKHLSEESLANLKKVLEKSINTQNVVTSEYIFYDLPGCPSKVYLRSALRVIATAGTRRLVYCANENITAQKEAEIKNETLAENMRHLMDDTPGGFARMQLMPNGKVRMLYANRVLCEMRGMTYEELMTAEGEDALSNVHPDDIGPVREALASIEKDETKGEIEYRLRCGNGEYVWVSVFRRITHNEEGETFINIYYKNLSDEEKKELTLKETIPHILSAIMKSSPDLAFAKDKDFNYICCSPGFVRFTRQKTEADVIGKNDYDFWTKEEADHFRGDDEQLYASGESMINYLEPIPWDDDIPHYSRTSKYVIRDTQGEIIGMYGLGVDITQSRLDYEKMKLLAENIHGGIATYSYKDSVPKLLFFNDGYAEVLGYTREEYEEVTVDNPLPSIETEDAKRIIQSAEDLVNEGRPMELICRARTKSGEEKWLNLRGVLSEKQGETAFIHTILLDVTSQQLQLNLEKNRPIVNEEYLIHRMRFNLTKRETLEYCLKDGTPVPVDEQLEFLGGKRKIESALFHQEDYDEFAKLHNVDALLEDFKNGINKHQIDYIRVTVPGEVLWTRDTLLLMSEPSTGDVLLFKYIYNIEEEKVNELLRQELVNIQYDFITRIYAKTKHFEATVSEKATADIPKSGIDADAVAIEVANRDVHPDDREYVLKNTLIEGIRENLKDRDRFEFTGRTISPDGSVRYKRLTEFYLDREREVLIIIREDITEITKEEQRKSEALTEALKLANEESRIKERKTAEQLRAIMDNLNGGVSATTIIDNKNINDVFANDMYYEMFGYTKEQFESELPRGLLDIIHPDDIEKVREGIERSKTEDKITLEYRVKRRDGILIWVRSSTSICYVTGVDEPVHLSVILDITKEKEAEENLRISEEQFRIAATIGDRFVARYDIKNEIYYHEGYSVLKAQGFGNKIENAPQTFLDAKVVHPGSIAAYCKFYDNIKKGIDCSSDVKMRVEGEEFTWTRGEAKVIFDAQGEPSQAVIVFQDISKQREHKLRAETDPLTGVLNRRECVKEIEEHLHRTKPKKLTAFLMLDIDGFKALNDTLGHSMGDKALLDIAKTLREKMREGDLIGRVGGDEFVMCLQNMPNDEAIEKRAKDICHSVNKPLTKDVTLSASIGIAVCPRDGESFDALYKKADIALYEVKSSSKNGYAFYNSDNEK